MGCAPSIDEDANQHKAITWATLKGRKGSVPLIEARLKSPPRESMTAELIYKSFHSRDGSFRTYNMGVLTLTEKTLTYSVVNRPDLCLKVTLWNLLRVDSPPWIAREGLEVHRGHPLIVIQFLDDNSGMGRELIFDVPEPEERKRLLKVLKGLQRSDSREDELV